MPEPARLHLPTWAVALTALLGPLVIAFGFISLFSLANAPVPAIEYQSDPSMGQKIASHNDALIFLHALAQSGFVLLGGLFAPSRRARVLFLLLALLISGFVFLVTLIGLLAG